MARILFAIGILILCEATMINASGRRSKTKVDMIIGDICERLHDDDHDFYSDENRKWHTLCEEWIKIKGHGPYKAVQDKNIMDERSMTHTIQLRRGRGSSRSSRGGSRSSRSRIGSRSSSSSITRFRNIRTGATINRPNGWQWSRSRFTFLPLATRYFHRSRSSSSRFTTPAVSVVTYYYCTSTNNSSTEIQCNSINGDTQCCEEETTHQPFCCGGKVSEDFVADVNRATQLLARIFYTLAAITLCIHVFIRRFYR